MILRNLEKDETIIGYTTGVYDLFHIGHLNLLKNAKGLCDKLVVGVTVDDLVLYKGKKALIPFEDRIEIVRSCKYVDAAVPQYDMDKLNACKKLGASVLFVGDDWYGTEKWQKYEKEFTREGIKIIYFPYTRGISSTKINEALHSVRGWSKTTDNTCTSQQHKIDSSYCMSSFLTFRYVINDNVDFFNNLHHTTKHLEPENKKISVRTAQDIDKELQRQFDFIKNKRLGLLLSGGMDSACLASYMQNQYAYTFRFMDGKYQNEELERAKMYAKKYNLKLHYVDISWENTIVPYLDKVMEHKGSPVHSIEPQIAQAAVQAKSDGIEIMIFGDAADYIFGGMDGLYAKDWTYYEFKKRFTYVNPEDVLVNPFDMDFAFQKYRAGNNIKYIDLMHEYTDIESYSSYDNAFKSVGMEYLDPYEILKMEEPLDLSRIRNGESKYLIRDLFRVKYPEMPVPEKLPMPRPVDEYFKNWEGPTRAEFRKDIDIKKYSGNQKWLIWCLEQFLNKYSVEKTVTPPPRIYFIIQRYRIQRHELYLPSIFIRWR